MIRDWNKFVLNAALGLSVVFGIIGVAMTSGCATDKIGEGSFKSGDTVIVAVAGHGHFKGIVRAIYGNYSQDCYIKMLDSPWHGWHATYNIRPYKAEWDVLNQQMRAEACADSMPGPARDTLTWPATAMKSGCCDNCGSGTCCGKHKHKKGG